MGWAWKSWVWVIPSEPEWVWASPSEFEQVRASPREFKLVWVFKSQIQLSLSLDLPLKKESELSQVSQKESLLGVSLCLILKYMK